MITGTSEPSAAPEGGCRELMGWSQGVTARWGELDINFKTYRWEQQAGSDGSWFWSSKAPASPLASKIQALT